MKYTTIIALFLALAAALLTVAGCERSTEGLQPAPFDNNPIVFQDAFDGIDYHAFLGTKLDAFDVDNTQGFNSEASIKVTVPRDGDPTGAFAGGTITSNYYRDLSEYNALAFWAKASKNATFALVGYGNDNSGNSLYMGAMADIDLTTAWQRYIIPIPRTGVLVPERGLFQFADANDDGSEYIVWFDEIVFVNVDAITNPRPIMRQDDVSATTGLSLTVEETATAFDITVPTPETITVGHSSGYFTFFSSDESVAVPDGGVIHVVGGGTAEITAKLDTVVVAGRFTITALDPPTDPAPVPTVPAADVTSIFSNAYTDWPVDTFSPEWDTANVSDLKIAGDDVKVYNIPTPLDVAVIEFATHTIDATSMTHVHIDIWAPAGSFFGLGLVDFGPDGIYNPPPGGDDSDYVVAVVPPELVFGQWLSLDIPLDDYMVSGGLDERAHLAQIILRSDSVQLIVDNIYFYTDRN